MQHELLAFPCPLCNGSGVVPRAPRVTGYIRTRMLSLIIDHPNGISANDLLKKLYGEDPARWPQTDTKVIGVLIWNANKQLKPQGFKIICRWRGGRGGHSPYVLVKLDADTEREPAADLHLGPVEGAQSASA